MKNYMILISFIVIIFIVSTKGFTQEDKTDINVQQLLSKFDYEPKIKDVQKAAIEYAKIRPDLVNSLIKRIHYKALLPKFQVTLDRKLNDRQRFATSTNSTISSSTGNIYTGPNDESLYLYTYDDLGLKFSADWQLSELVFDSDELRVPSINKDMVNLRNDIVSEVTKIYYDRRRIQLELLVSPPQDPKERIKQELKIQELTAQLDGLTGGYFSNFTGSK